jgi:hypothetical protein
VTKFEQIHEENNSLKDLLESEKAKSSIFERVKNDLEGKE